MSPSPRSHGVLRSKRVFHVVALFAILCALLSLAQEALLLSKSETVSATSVSREFFSTAVTSTAIPDSLGDGSPSESPLVTPVILDHEPKDDTYEDDAVEILWTQWYEFEQIVKSAFLDPRQLFCVTIEDAVAQSRLNETKSSRLPKVHVTFAVSCFDVFSISGWGTGNYIQTILMMRLSMRYISIARVKLNITCTDPEEVQWNLILPWFTGVWYSPNYFQSVSASHAPKFAEIQGPLENSRTEMPPLSDEYYCGPSHNHPTAIMYDEVKYAARRMAVALLGVSFVGTDYTLSSKIQHFLEQYIYGHGDHVGESNFTKHSVHLSPGNQQIRISQLIELTPIFPADEQIEIDDAVAHVRCGDILGGDSGAYGFMSFPGYSRLISPDVRTIGILAQPFCEETNVTDDSSILWQRKRDAKYCQRCQTLAMAFLQFLSEEFPKAIVKIRNDPSEALSLVYARMVLANQSIGCLSTFSIYPIVATFGEGQYLRQSPTSMWLRHPHYPISYANPDNFQLFDDHNTISGPEVKDLWDSQGNDAVIQWFRTGGIAVNATES